MATPEQHTRINLLVVSLIVGCQARRIPYKEAMAAFRCAAEVMEQINKTPNAADESLEALCQAVVDKELA